MGLSTKSRGNMIMIIFFLHIFQAGSKSPGSATPKTSKAAATKASSPKAAPVPTKAAMAVGKFDSKSKNQQNIQST